MSDKHDKLHHAITCVKHECSLPVSDHIKLVWEAAERSISLEREVKELKGDLNICELQRDAKRTCIINEERELVIRDVRVLLGALDQFHEWNDSDGLWSIYHKMHSKYRCGGKDVTNKRK